MAAMLLFFFASLPFFYFILFKSYFFDPHIMSNDARESRNQTSSKEEEKGIKFCNTKNRKT